MVRTDSNGPIKYYLDYCNPLITFEALTPSSEGSEGELGVTFGG